VANESIQSSLTFFQLHHIVLLLLPFFVEDAHVLYSVFSSDLLLSMMFMHIFYLQT
jgi:hypothetical protein